MSEKIKIVENPERLDGLKVVNDTETMIKTISSGETIAHFEWGHSMEPVLHHGQYCRIAKIKTVPEVGDAVFCNVGGYWMTHMVWIVNKASGYCLIGSTSGEMYGWTNKILGIATPMPYIEKENAIENEV